MATLKEITHDSSTTLSDFYGTINDPDSAITVSIAAALGGSVNGLAIDNDAGANSFDIADSFSGSTPSSVRWRVRVDLSGLTNANSSAFLVDFETDGAAGTDSRIQIEINGDGTNGFEVTGVAKQDVAPTLRTIGPVAISAAGEVCIELSSDRETADGNDDGTLELFLDGVSQGSLSDVQNFNDFDFDNLSVFFDSPAAISGAYKCDEFILTDVSGTSLCGPGSHIWLSTDGGATYSNIGGSWGSDLVGGVVVVPGTAYQTIFGAVGTNLYKTVNGGAAWTLEVAIGYEVDFISLEKDNETVFLAKRDAGGTNRASLWDGSTLSHLNTGKSTTGGATAGGDVV